MEESSEAVPGADLNAVDNSGKTALQFAAQMGNPDILKALRKGDQPKKGIFAAFKRVAGKIKNKILGRKEPRNNKPTLNV